MKKSIVFALVLALLLALAAPAFAFAIERSAQNLTVDGKAVVCDKYNIDGNNYFKLRDLAKLLNGTGSQFDVSWDADQQLVSITTKHPYTMPTGSELVVGEDKSATAVLSSQTIMIDGTVRRDLTVYNIGGSNFFKLRELGDALGFDVDYDPDSNTAIVASRGKPASASDLRLNDFCSITGKYAGDAGYYEYYSFSLPKITGADTACIRSVNAAVQEIYEQHVQTALSALAEQDYLPCTCVCYKYAVNAGVHSLLITANSDWGASYYWCFNFDDQGNEVKNAEVLKAAGLTEAGFLAAAKAFLTDYTDLSGYVDDEEFWKPLQAQTIAADNLNAYMPMALLPDGRLCFIATVYTPAGAGQYDYALRFNAENEVETYNDFGVIMIDRFYNSYLVDSLVGGDEGMRYLLRFFTIGDQLSVEVTAFDEEYGSAYYYFAADITPENAADMLRGDLDSLKVSVLSYCPDVMGGSYYGEPGRYTLSFTGHGVAFSDFAGGTPLVGDGDFTATIAYLDDLGMEDPVPGTNYELFDYDAVEAAGLAGIWTGTYNDLAGESHGLTLEINSWGELWLRDVTDTDIPRVLAGSYYIAAEGDQMAPAGSVVFHLVSLAGYKMPNLGFCTMTVGSDGKLRITDSTDSVDGLTGAGDGVTVTLTRVPRVQKTVYAEP